jgi:hypothetical protein
MGFCRLIIETERIPLGPESGTVFAVWRKTDEPSTLLGADSKIGWFGSGHGLQCRAMKIAWKVCAAGAMTAIGLVALESILRAWVWTGTEAKYRLDLMRGAPGFEGLLWMACACAVVAAVAAWCAWEAALAKRWIRRGLLAVVVLAGVLATAGYLVDRHERAKAKPVGDIFDQLKYK